MLYNVLIRRLVTVSEESRSRDEDIADRLVRRCVEETDLIRQTLMNAVCDPRFKMHVGVVRGWKRMAMEALHNLVGLLQSVPDLTDEIARFIMNEFLDEWLSRMLKEAMLTDADRLRFTPIPKDKNSMAALQMREALEDFVGKPKKNDDKEDEENDIYELMLEWENGGNSGKKQQCDDMQEDDDDGVGDDDMDDKDDGVRQDSNDDGDNESESPQEGDKENDAKHDEKDVREKPRKNDKPKESRRTIGGEDLRNRRRLENNFLTKVPPSLIRLAKIIGRSGDDITTSSSSFSTASKSDIEGITTGNDLSSLLPSELATLSDTDTQNLFYRNYVTRRLQVFASRSMGGKGKKHRDGPIIICLDTSSSMDGDPVMVATALTMAICIIAQRKRRSVLVIRYSDTHTLFRLQNIGNQRGELMDFLREVDMAGNDEDKMFKWLFGEILPEEGNYDTADILCISDFGWGPIHKDTMRMIEEEKAKGMKFYGLNIGNQMDSERYNLLYPPTELWSDDSGYASPFHVCDSLWEFSDGECKEVK